MKYFRLLCLAVIIILFAPIFINLLRAATYSNSEVDCYLVPGGSVALESMAADLLIRYPKRKLVVSGGSRGPCIKKLFEQYEAPTENVFVEPCAKSTFENFYFAAPLLKTLGVKHIVVITSEKSAQRILFMGSILLKGQGFAMDLLIVPGRYSQIGHSESQGKTFLDAMRSLLWLFPAQYINKTNCEEVKPLSAINSETAGTPACHCHPIPKKLKKEYSNFGN